MASPDFAGFAALQNIAGDLLANNGGG